MAKLIFPVEDISTRYQEGSAVTAAKKALEEQLKAKPQAYKSQWQTQLDDVMNKIMNREKFSYDFNGDALYQQYKDKFVQQGKMASADVMGQAAAMTGGYGNSYAATVGNQAYQASLQNLNDIVPELYQMALDQYNQQGQDLYNQYGIISDRENADYGKYRDTVGDWQTDRNYLASMYDSERNFDYGKHSDEVSLAYNKFIDDRNYDYQVDRDSIEDDHWDKQFKQEQDKIDLANRDIDAEVEAKYNAKVDDWAHYVADLEAKVNSGGGSSGGNGGGNGGGNTQPTYTYEETPAVKSFAAKIRTPHEFSRGSNTDNQKYKTYKDYVKGMLEKYESGLSDNDIATIAQKFGL